MKVIVDYVKNGEERFEVPGLFGNGSYTVLATEADEKYIYGTVLETKFPDSFPIGAVHKFPNITFKRLMKGTKITLIQ